MLTVPNELALTESRTMRAATVDRTDVLDKVKALALLPDAIHATTDLVANYYEVDIEAVNSLVRRNRAELEENGLRKLTGPELKRFKDATDGQNDHQWGRSGSLRLFGRRTILNVGQLLTESEVARRVRTYLLEVEEQAPASSRSQILSVSGPLPYREQAEILAILSPVLPAPYVAATGKIIMARSMGERPALDPSETPLYASTFLAEKGHKAKTVQHFQQGFGQRVSNLYLKVNGRRPEKIPGPAGSRIENVAFYTDDDRPLLEKVYDSIGDLIRAFEDGDQLRLGSEAA